MMHLYHYCATWFDEGRAFHSGGVMRSPDTICYGNYPDFLAAVAREVGHSNFTITSLSFLGKEE